MSAGAGPGEVMGQANPEVRYHVRFTLGQRYLHATLMTTFIGLALTGLPLRFSHSVSGRTFRPHRRRIYRDPLLPQILRRAAHRGFPHPSRRRPLSRRGEAPKRGFLGPELARSAAKGLHRSLRALPVVSVARSATEIRPVLLLGEIRLLGRLLGHGDHRHFRLRDVVRAVFRQIHPGLVAERGPAAARRGSAARRSGSSSPSISSIRTCARKASRWTWSSSPERKPRRSS